MSSGRGRRLQKVVLPWTLIDGPRRGGVRRAARRAADHRWQRTSISAALIYAGNLFGTSQYRGVRRVIDISGDGPNNSGPPGGVTPVRDRLVSEGIIINGLPIILRPGGGGWGSFDISDLDVYYAECVIGGPGSFMIPIREPGEFLTATRQKLLIEISDLMSKPRVQFAQGFDATAAGQLRGRRADVAAGVRIPALTLRQLVFRRFERLIPGEGSSSVREIRKHNQRFWLGFRADAWVPSVRSRNTRVRPI